jgi:hypothetical protein
MSLILLILLIAPSEAATPFASFPPKSCSIRGDPDIYGVGIRLNYYLQYVSLLLLPYLSSSPESYALQATLQTTNILTISIYTCTLLTLSPSTLVALEWWILYFLTFMPFIGFVSNKTILMKRSVAGLGFTGFLWCTLSFAGCWVWFVGVDYGQRAGCEVKLFFFFHAINLSDKIWRIIFKIASVVACVLGVFVLGSYFIRFWNKVTKKECDVEVKDIDTPAGIGDNDTGVLRVGMTMFQLLFGIFAIVQVEMTLKSNHVDLPGSPISAMGQLIPFVGGIYTFIVVLYSGLTTHWKGKSVA